MKSSAAIPRSALGLAFIRPLPRFPITWENWLALLFTGFLTNPKHWLAVLRHHATASVLLTGRWHPQHFGDINTHGACPFDEVFAHMPGQARCA